MYIGILDEVKIITASDKKLINTKGNLGNTALFWAASGGYTDICEYLCSNGADVNLANSIKDTPLHSAAWKNHPQVITILLSHNANTRAKNKAGQIPNDLARSVESRRALNSNFSSSNIIMAEDSDSD